MFASFVLCRRGLVVVSSWARRRVVVNSLPSGKALGGVFCVFLLLRPKTLIALSRLREVAPNRVLLACPRRLCVAGAIDLHHLAASCCVFFCESHCQRCAKWCQGANSVAGVAFSDM